MVNSALIFLASLAGIFAFFVDNSSGIFITVLVLFIVGIAMTFAAHHVTRRVPVKAVWMFQAWQVVPLTFIFLGAFGSAWLSLNLLDWLPITFSNDPNQAEAVKAEKATIESLTTTAITALLAAVVLDAARDPESKFWPAERHKAALKAAFHTSPVFDLDLTGLAKSDAEKKQIKHAIQDLSAAYIEEKTADNKATGWTFQDRLHRARVIATALRTLSDYGIEV